MIEFTCSHCDHYMELPDEFAGHRATCTRCGIPFETPRADAAYDGVEAEASSEDVWAELHGGSAAGARAGGAASRGEGKADDPQFPDWIEDRARLSSDRLSPLFWAAAYFMPPVAFFWGLSLPRRHPQKRIAMILPCVWLAIIASVGGVTRYVLPQLAEQAQSQTAAQSTSPQMNIANGGAALEKLPAANRPARFDVTKLKVGEVYLVTGDGVNVRNQPGRGSGFGGLTTLYKLPAGGIFEIVYIETIDRRPWYQVIVTDGKKSYYMWIYYRDLLRAELKPVARPTFANPHMPKSAPITSLW